MRRSCPRRAHRQLARMPRPSQWWAQAGVRRAPHRRARSDAAGEVPSVVTKNGVPVDSWAFGSSKEFLADLPRGAYTTARTVRAQSAVFELPAHVERTAQSLQLMFGNIDGNPN
eukprot:SAG31_NODE_2989_length_4813_cov_8.205346_7_plen_114_part_00